MCAGRKIKIKTTTATLSRQMTREKLARSVVTLDLAAVLSEANDLQLKVRAGFCSVRIAARNGQLPTLFVGCCGGRVELTLREGILLFATEDMSTIHRTRSATSKLSLEGKAEPKVGVKPISVSAGALSATRASEKTETLSWENKEARIAAHRTEDRVSWDIAGVTPSAFREFLHETFELEAEIQSAEKPLCRGTVNVSPTDLAFFRNDRRALSPVRSALMAWVLNGRPKNHVAFAQGLRTDFDVEEEDAI